MIHPDIVRGMGLKQNRKVDQYWEWHSRKLASMELGSYALGEETFGALPDWMYKIFPFLKKEEPAPQKMYIPPAWQPKPTEEKPITPTTATLPEYTWGARTLRLTSPYMRGTDVYNLQYALFNLKFFSQIRDGIYGPVTEAAVKKYQVSKGLAADGIVGPQTWTNLGRDWQGYAEQKYEEAKALYATVPPVKKEAVTKITAGQSTKPVELVEEKAFPWGWVLLIGGLILFAKSKP